MSYKIAATPRMTGEEFRAAVGVIVDRWQSDQITAEMDDLEVAS